MTLQKLCGEIYKTASSCINFFRDIEVDQGSKASIQSGLALGVIVLSALILFPGNVKNVEQQIIQRDDEQSTVEDEWIGDRLSSHKREKMRKISGLSADQMSEAMKNAKEEWKQQHFKKKSKSSYSNCKEVHDAETISLAQQVNFFVYFVLLGALLYFMNRDYNGVITKVFSKYFPREAKTLGLI